MSSIESYLRNCQELTRFCSQNGWIDNSSMRFIEEWLNDHEVLVVVEFEELLMEGTSYLGRKIPCIGQMHLFLNREGEVIRGEIT